MDKLSWYFDEGPVWTVILEQMRWEKAPVFGCQIPRLSPPFPTPSHKATVADSWLFWGISNRLLAVQTQQPHQLRQRQGTVKVEPLAGSSPGATHWTPLHSKTHFRIHNQKEPMPVIFPCVNKAYLLQCESGKPLAPWNQFEF